jgi:hypothetical protein
MVGRICHRTLQTQIRTVHTGAAAAELIAPALAGGDDRTAVLLSAIALFMPTRFVDHPGRQAFRAIPPSMT